MKTWGRAIITAAWFAALVGLAQLGIGSATGAVRIGGAYDQQDLWTSQLVWLAWFTGQAVLAGTIVGVNAARRRAANPGLGSRLSAAVAACVGGCAALAVALMQVRDAQIHVGDPMLIAAITMGVGAAIGLLSAIVVLSHRSFIWNAISMIVMTWLVFAASILPSSGDLARLGVVTTPGSPIGDQLVPFGLPALAGIVGLVVALAARIKGQHRGVVAISGSIGPALVGFAYAIAGPGESDYQHRPWLAALISVGAGLLGSLLVGAWPRRSDTAVARPTTPPDDTVTEDVPVRERDSEFVGWVSGLTDGTGKPQPPRQRRSGDAYPADSWVPADPDDSWAPTDPDDSWAPTDQSSRARARGRHTKG